MNTRKTIFVSVVVLLLVLVGAWWYFGFSLDFMRFFAAEPGVTDTNVTGGTPTDVTRGTIPPAGCTLQNGAIVCQTVACTADSSTVTVGTAVNIRAYGGTGGYTMTAPGGTITMSQNTLAIVGAVKYGTPGIKQILVISKRASDASLTDVASCRVTVIPAAIINQ